MDKLPEIYRKVRLALAREPGHPEGDRGIGYDLVLPLDDDGRIDLATWRAHPGLSFVRRFAPDADDMHGKLARRRDGTWVIDYDPKADTDDEPGYRLGDETFVPGEYVSITDTGGHAHTYRVISISLP